MLIVDYKAGQLANRLFLFSYFIAHALEYNYCLINPWFKEYEDLFEFTNRRICTGNIRFSFSDNTFLNKYFRKSINGLRIVAQKTNGRLPFIEFHNIRQQYDDAYKIFDMSQPSFVKKARNKILLAKGWNYRDNEAFLKHAEAIRKIFEPKEVYKKQVEEVMSKVKDYDICIGVHIRKGDYKKYMNGRWFYEDEVYAAKMYSLQNKFSDEGKRCVFLVCTNEPLQKSSFKGLNVIADEQLPVTDLYSLSKCNYIIGPPSTFTMWASFYGQVPLFVMKSNDINPLIKDFKAAEGVESFF